MQCRNQQWMQIRCQSVWPSVMYSVVAAFNTACKSLLNLVCFKYLIMTIKDFKQNCLKSHYSLFSPVPQINWRRTDGLPFPSKIKLRKSNGMIEIPNFQQEDAGLYECITENSRGKNIARGRLTYYGRKPLFCLSPTFLYSQIALVYPGISTFCSSIRHLDLKTHGFSSAPRKWELLQQFLAKISKK